MSPASPDRLPERVAPPDADRILAAEYVLGTLDNEDRRRVRARCAAEPQFAALVRMWERRLAPLHELAVPVIPSPDIWRAIASDLRSAPPALRGASLPRGMSPSPDPPRRPAMPEGRALRSAAGAGEGAVSRVRRLFGFGRSAEPGRADVPRGADRPSRRRAFPPLDPAPVGPPVPQMEAGRGPAGMMHDARPAGVLPQGTSQIARQAFARPENAPAVERLPEPKPPLKLVPPPPRPRPAPEPLTPPPAFMFLEPDTPVEPEPLRQDAEEQDAAAKEPADAVTVTSPADAPATIETAEVIQASAASAPAEAGAEVVAAAPVEDVPPAPAPDVPREAEEGDAAPAPAAEAEAVPSDDATGRGSADATAEVGTDVPAPAGGPVPDQSEAPSGEAPSADPAAGDKGEEAPLPGWAAAVASGEVSALPDEPAAPVRVIVRPGPWRGISLLLALLCLGLGSALAYREWIWPGAGYWVAVMQAESLPAVSVRIDPDSGAVHVRSFAPAPPEGETYRLWLLSATGAPRLIGAFSAGLSERLPELARLGRRGLAGTELVVTREPVVRADAAKGPGEAVVYRGRLVPE